MRVQPDSHCHNFDKKVQITVSNALSSEMLQIAQSNGMYPSKMSYINKTFYLPTRKTLYSDFWANQLLVFNIIPKWHEGNIRFSVFDVVSEHQINPYLSTAA